LMFDIKRLVRKVLLLIFVFVVFTTGCTSKQDDRQNEYSSDCDAELESLHAENKELLLRIEVLNELLESKDKTVFELNDINNQSISLEFYEVEITEVHGYGVLKEKSVDLKTLPLDNSNSFVKISDLVEIIGQVKTSNNENWFLVKSNKKNTFGYIRADNIDTFGYFQEFYDVSSMSISNLRLGDTESDMIKLIGQDFKIKNVSDYANEDIATYYEDESKEIWHTQISYDSVTKIINRIHTFNESYKVDGVYGVGDDIEEAIAYFRNKFECDLYDNKYVVEDSSGYYLTLYFDDNLVITSVLYKINEIDA